jgi:hypothetical protein
MGKTVAIRKHPKLYDDHLWRLQISGQRRDDFNMDVGFWQLALTCPSLAVVAVWRMPHRITQTANG